MDAPSLAIYLPQDRRQASGRDRLLPERATGSALFADISGFTALTEALTRTLGPRHGAEEVSNQLNRAYTALIAQVDHFGGSVISFSGDAITCWFDENNELLEGDNQLSSTVPPAVWASLRAVACALALQEALRAFDVLALPESTISLGIKVAVTSGPVRRFLVGDPDIQRIDVLGAPRMPK